MYLECILVCVDYADFLAHTLPFNIAHFDHVVVVTAPHDYDTQQLCAQYGASIVVSQRMFEDDAAFNKGKAINDGVTRLVRHDWVLITDADMIMPRNLRAALETFSLDPEVIYGTSRYLCPTYADWRDYRRTLRIPETWQHQSDRLCIGVGFFQLVNVHSSILDEKTKWYSEQWNYAGRSDRAFLRLWDRSKRARLPGVEPVHLNSSMTASYKANWYGRMTPPFGGHAHTVDGNADPDI